MWDRRNKEQAAYPMDLLLLQFPYSTFIYCKAFLQLLKPVKNKVNRSPTTLQCSGFGKGSNSPYSSVAIGQIHFLKLCCLQQPRSRPTAELSRALPLPVEPPLFTSARNLLCYLPRQKYSGAGSSSWACLAVFHFSSTKRPSALCR